MVKQGWAPSLTHSLKDTPMSTHSVADLGLGYEDRKTKREHSLGRQTVLGADHRHRQGQEASRNGWAKLRLAGRGRHVSEGQLAARGALRTASTRGKPEQVGLGEARWRALDLCVRAP